MSARGSEAPRRKTRKYVYMYIYNIEILEYRKLIYRYIAASY